MGMKQTFLPLILLTSLAWSAPGGLVARYGFADGAALGHDSHGTRHMACTGGASERSPKGPAAAFDGDGGMELAAAECPAFRSGFGLDFWLRLDDMTGPMLVAGRDGQFLLRLDPLQENGRLSLFIRGDTWEPRLRGPRLNKGQWYHVQAGWNGRQMVLQVGDSVARQQRRLRMRPTTAPFLLGKKLEWGSPLKGALADVQVLAPPPTSWFKATPVERVAGARLKVFEVDNAYPRAGRPETVNLRLRADQGQPATQVMLQTGPGLALSGRATRPVPALGPNESAELTWQVQAKAPGNYALVLTDKGGVTQRRQVQFRPSVPQRKLAYVPPPEPVKTEVLVGAQMCPLWKEGARRAVWEPIVPWEKRKPLLGWYDEGDPEVMDWEIKWSLDHGISFFVYCWYRTSQGGPVEHKLGHGIHDGLFRSRYGDKFKFSIMWENQGRGTSGISSEEDFLQNLLPFWLKTYFKRGTYLVIDGKPLLYIYRPEFLVNDLGSIAKVRQALDKARAACRDAGFKGLTLLGEYRGSNPKHLQLLVDLGIDCSFAYCWPLPGSPSSEKAVGMQEEILRERRKTNILPEMINVSMGWDSRPWHPSASIWRHTPADFAEACKRALKATKEYPEGSLSRRVVILDNWNEYGEGHYLAPHRQYGFGYLDAVREAFAPNAPHEHQDLTPADVGLGPYDSLYQTARREDERILRLLTAKPQKAVQEEGLVAYWSFDGQGDVDVAVDQSGHGLGARLRKTALVPGKAGRALVCAGGSAQTSKNPALFPEHLTISCWIRTDEAKQSDRWFVNSIYGGTTDSGFRLGMTGGGRLCWGVPETEWSHHLAAKEPLPLGRWVHVAATADNQAMRIYMDGKEVAKTERSVPVGAPLGRHLTLGNYEHQHRAHFIGLLDEVRLYDRVLTPAQIETLAKPAAR
jgi:hypothetical protein